MTAFPSTCQLLVAQTRYQLVTFWRIPVAVFFTLGLPLIMLVLFNALFGSGTFSTSEGEMSAQQFYTGGLAAFTAVSATFTNLANMVPIRRDEGVLKRWRGTPLPTWVYLAGFIVSADDHRVRRGRAHARRSASWCTTSTIEPAKMPAAILTFLVGVGSFAALGMALAALVKSASSASAAANAIILPMAFVSNIFIQVDDPPRLDRGRSATSSHSSTSPKRSRTASPRSSSRRRSSGRAWVTSALWGVLGLVVALKRFTWEPSGSAPRGPAAPRRAATAT